MRKGILVGQVLAHLHRTAEEAPATRKRRKARAGSSHKRLRLHLERVTTTLTRSQRTPSPSFGRDFVSLSMSVLSSRTWLPWLSRICIATAETAVSDRSLRRSSSSTRPSRSFRSGTTAFLTKQLAHRPRMTRSAPPKAPITTSQDWSPRTTQAWVWTKLRKSGRRRAKSLLGAVWKTS